LISVVTTACPLNCYSTCTLRVHLENGKIRRIEADPRNRATSNGICIRGQAQIERVYSKDRILHPLRRVGNDRFEKIDWDRAIDEIADNLQKFKKESGSQSVMLLEGSGTKGLLNNVALDFFKIYGGCTTTYGDLCWPAGLEATRLSLGENKHSAPWDLANSRLVIIWGKNPAETNIHQTVFIDQALERGARLVVIDPRRTQTAERADVLLQPLPGTDGALALCVARQIIENEDLDLDFIERHVHGFAQFKKMVGKYNPDHVEKITGIPAASIKLLAAEIGVSESVTIVAGFGMQRYSNSGQTMRAIISLLAITGNIGKPGAGWSYANLKSHIFGPKDPLAAFPLENPKDGVRVSVSQAGLGKGIAEQVDPPIRMIWVERANPLSQNPDTQAVAAAFGGIEFKVVVDQFMTDTARRADIVLPAKSIFEQTDVITAYWHDYIQLRQKVIDPPGEVKPETEIFRLLAKRMGLNDERIREFLPGPSTDEIEKYLERKLEPFEGITMEALRKGPVPSPFHEEVAFADKIFATPTKKIELLSEEASRRWDVKPLPEYSEPVVASSSADAAKKYPLCMMTPNTQNATHSQFHNLQTIRKLGHRPFVFVNPADAESRGIKDGVDVRVFNERGEFATMARLDFGIRIGCVAVYNGWQEVDGARVNLLSEARMTDMGFGTAFHEVRVEVERG
jgi:anaerobic selenocysteine-containing dehydrogenase